MKILYLGPYKEEPIKYMESFGDDVIQQEGPIVGFPSSDYIVSFGYKYLLSPDVIDAFYRRAINIHISYLPYNRGYDPNYWSFRENTPKGVTIHYMDKGIDTGDIIRQMEVPWFMDDTLKTSYNRLMMFSEKLFELVWLELKELNGMPLRCHKQEGKGTFHQKKDLDGVSINWSDTVREIVPAYKQEVRPEPEHTNFKSNSMWKKM